MVGIILTIIAILLVDTGRARLIRTRLIRFCEIFARFLSFHVYNAQLIQTWLIRSSTNLK